MTTDLESDATDLVRLSLARFALTDITYGEASEGAISDVEFRMVYGTIGKWIAALERRQRGG